MGFLFVSSGHFYRALAWGVVRDSVSEEALPQWIGNRRLDIVETAGPETAQRGVQLLLDGSDATPHLSDPEVAAKVSLLAVFPEVRDLINGHLRALAASHNLVMEGRDIGSVVFPETPYKFYLDASPEERARRRAGEGAVDSVAERDRIDSSRATAPLTIPKGATVIDTTHLNLSEVIHAVLEHLRKLGNFTPIAK